jgi:hypothetical protein
MSSLVYAEKMFLVSGFSGTACLYFARARRYALSLGQSTGGVRPQRDNSPLFTRCFYPSNPDTQEIVQWQQ